jgi:hypothetical protein
MGRHAVTSKAGSPGLGRAPEAMAGTSAVKRMKMVTASEEEARFKKRMSRRLAAIQVIFAGSVPELFDISSRGHQEGYGPLFFTSMYKGEPVQSAAGVRG